MSKQAPRCSKAVMPLLGYLQQYFYHEDEILEKAGINQQNLHQLQANKLLPKASYKLKLDIRCCSFLADASLSEHVNFYPKAILNWLKIVQELQRPDLVFDFFCAQYKQQLLQLENMGLVSDNPSFGQDIDAHLKQEWHFFMEGIYGLCTKTGLPIDIASKELSMDIIKTLQKKPKSSQAQQKMLQLALTVFDGSCAMFAAHEYANSSRAVYL